MSERYKRLKAHCEGMGINLLRDDVAFIERMLVHCEPTARQTCLKTYFQIWLDGMEEEGLHNRQNTGRHMANTWLRTRFGK